MKTMIKFVVLILSCQMAMANCSHMQLPPIQYDNPFDGRLIVEVLPYFYVSKACGRVNINDKRFEACARLFVDGMNKKACKIIYPRLEDVGSECFVNLIRHETGHCNGWTGEHENARYAE